MANVVRAGAAGGVAVVSLAGELRYVVSALIEEGLRQAMESEAVGELVLDLRGVSYLDSTCLGVLAQAAQRCRSRRLATPRLVCDNPDVEAVLSAMSFDQLFDICADVDGLPEGLELTDVGAPEEGATASGRRVLDAHRALAALNEKDQDLRRVVDLLEQELESGSSGG